MTRLEQVFKSIGKTASSKTCEAMKGLVEEGSEVINGTGDPNVKDTALIAAARVEHYEIAGYGTVRTFTRNGWARPRRPGCCKKRSMRKPRPIKS